VLRLVLRRPNFTINRGNFGYHPFGETSLYGCLLPVVLRARVRLVAAGLYLFSHFGEISSLPCEGNRK
jgi:hypothetical protein